MSKRSRTHQSRESENKQSRWALPVVGIIIVAFIAGAFVVTRQKSQPSSNSPIDATSANSNLGGAPNQVVVAQPPAASNATKPLSMEVAKAVMVTAELDGVTTVPSALAQIERRYAPDDGTGRTFAILDAYGELTPAGKLHISMHVSSEKPGMGTLIFKPTGEVLWNSRIKPTHEPVPAKNLNIYLTDDKGGSWIIDGSGNPPSILDAKVRDKGVLVRDFWPDGAEREATFVYSACGCPVKAMVRRTGERTVRTDGQPVMFPDDPAGLEAIKRLMRW